MALIGGVPCCPKHGLHGGRFIYDSKGTPHCPICNPKSIIRIEKTKVKKRIKELEKERKHLNVALDLIEVKLAVK